MKSMPKFKSTEHLWFINVRSLEALNGGKFSLSRNSGFASISFLSSMSIIFRADFVSPYLDSCSFCLYIIYTQSHPHCPNALYILLNQNNAPNEPFPPYLKFSKVSSCVISLNSSSLKEANTLRSFTSISTALARSCLQKSIQFGTTQPWYRPMNQWPREASIWATCRGLRGTSACGSQRISSWSSGCLPPWWTRWGTSPPRPTPHPAPGPRNASCWSRTPTPVPTCATKMEGKNQNPNLYQPQWLQNHILINLWGLTCAPSP